MQKKGNKKESERIVYLIDDKKSPFVLAEAFRKIITNIGFAIPKKEGGKGKVFCITSSIAKEGKTTVSANIALSAARSGAKTILIDCDLRKPALKRYFKSPKKGITGYLSGQAELEDIIARGIEPNLDIIVAKQSSPNPLVLLHSEAFDDLIEKLSSNYDYVILDTPPLGLCTDSLIIGKKTDGIVFVTRQRCSNHKMIKHLVDQIKFADCQIIGFILNDVSVSNSSYYGKRYSNYNYDYK